MKKYIISCDLGGTKCAAGITQYNLDTADLACQKSCSIKLREVFSLAELIEQIEEKLDVRFSEIDAICIGGAGHYDGASLIYENNYPYPMNFATVAKEKKWPPFAVIHDYAPIVCATFTSFMDQPENVKRLNSAAMNKYGRRIALGLGTGLGMKDGVLLPDGGFWLGQNEIGHIGISLPPTAPVEKIRLHEELMNFLKNKCTSMTFEKILSGPGIVNLYEFFYPGREKCSPEEVGIAMRNGQASELNNAFAWYLGYFIGTVQLGFMPDGGIWITGGVALSHLDVFDHANFYSGINASPAYLTQRSHYPLGILANQNHALIGGGYYAAKRLLEV
jgi:glucokinase